MKTINTLFTASMLTLSLHSMAKAPIKTKSLKWNVKSKTWKNSDEAAFGSFVQSIGMGKERGECHTTLKCLTNPNVNPYQKFHPKGFNEALLVDCADLPHILRGYFAWMYDLPFSYQKSISILSPKNGPASMFTPQEKAKVDQYTKSLAAHKRHLQTLRPGFRNFNKRRKTKAYIRKVEKYLNALHAKAARRNDGRSAEKEDIRYSLSGNKINSRRIVKKGENINQVLMNITNAISTASFRTNVREYDTGKNFRDIYPIKLDRESIVPGTIIYDPAGHIALVYKVTKSGRIYMIDAHPDNSLTRIVFGEKFSRSPMKRGAGFSRFRPFKETRDGKKHIPVENYELADFSLEAFQGYPQIEGVDTRGAKYILDDISLSYHDFVRFRAADGYLTVDPVEELDQMLGDLCEDMKERAKSVKVAVQEGIHNKRHPLRLPNNIYGTHGEWENYSTPSRDARIKASLREIHRTTKKYISWYNENSPRIESNSEDIISDLRSVYTRKTKSCKISYQNSNAKKLQMNLDQAISKLFKFSFDPYHCPELRWGLTDEANMRNCRNNNIIGEQDHSKKVLWYKAQRRLRNQIKRDYEKRMDLNLGELENSKIGVRYAPAISIKKLLDL